MLHAARLAVLLPLLLSTLASAAPAEVVGTDRRAAATSSSSSRATTTTASSRTTSTTKTTSRASTTSPATLSSTRAAVLAAKTTITTKKATTTTWKKTTTTTTTTSKKTTTTTRKKATTTAASSTRTTVTLAATTSAAPANTCAAVYSGAPTTVKGTGTLPKPTAFVKRSGQHLKLGSANYRIVGPNIYWACSDENVNGGAPSDKARVREAMAIAVAMGANTVRLHTCGVSVGPNNLYNWEQSLGNFSDAVAQARDYAIYAAQQYGLRVILPLTDNYDFYHGGKYSFLQFAGASTANKGALFYTHQGALNAFGQYIGALITRVNTYTGVSYANDPTILAWETGNEYGGWRHAESYPPAAFTSAVLNAIRSVDANHLIIDGTNGILDPNTGATPEGLKVAGVDVVTDHAYPRDTGLLQKEVALAKSAGKAFFIGEYDWTTQHGGSSLDSWLSMVESSGSYLGDMIWNVMGHDAQCCNFVPHNDGYSLYYPNGNSAADQANILKVVQHWYRVTGRAVPSKLPAVACPQPVF
ncbi:hypothetical protein JCM8547_005365 [Rhodosporidiobolus lusitaniae]